MKKPIFVEQIDENELIKLCIILIILGFFLGLFSGLLIRVII